MTHPSPSSLLSLLAADAHDRRLELARRFGFDGPVVPCGPELRERLGLDDALPHAHVVVGHGTLRALVVEDRSPLPLRERIRRVTRRLDARMPQWLWLLVLARPADAARADDDLAVAAWTAGAPRRPARTVALVAARRRLVPSDEDTLRLLAATPAAAAGADVVTHLRWLEILGREAVTRRFFLALRAQVARLADSLPHHVPPGDRHELALVLASRLLFLSFLETKGWLDADRDWLVHAFAHRMLHGGGFHRRTLLPLWFGTLNTPPRNRAPAARALGRIPFLNGGLFTRTPLERRHRDALLPDDALAELFDAVLTRFRFTAREDSGDWSEAAVDPEMLGKAFESLMGAGERRARGAFYTPQRLVLEVGARGLAAALSNATRAARAPLDADTVRDVLDGARPSPETADALRAALRSFRVVDPACGSGAFLVHALESLAALHARLGDPRPVSAIRRELAGRSIFGVDVQPIAVWLCELRLWLSVVIDLDEPDPLAVPPLPNLDRNVRVGDALLGGDFADARDREAGPRLTAIRLRYARATGARKRTLARLLDREERRVAIGALERRIAGHDRELRDRLASLRAPDLFGERRRPSAHDRDAIARLRASLRLARADLRRLRAGGALPFAFATHFADVADAAGFSCVLGNPPWVRPHHVPPATRLALRRLFTVARHAAWHDGARRSAAGSGFGGQADLAALFVERSLSLLHPAGSLALLVPAKLWRAVAGGGVRRLLVARTTVHALEDWSGHPALFDAVTYPSLLVASPAPDRDVAPAPVAPDPVDVAVHERGDTRRWRAPLAALRFADADGPWLLLEPAARDAFDRLRDAGPALDDARRHGIAVGRPTLGVKCGCNDAFVIRLAADGATIIPGGGRRPRFPGVAVAAGDRAAHVEPRLLRPLARGEGVRPWRVERGDEALLWTHGADGAPLAALPPLAARWFAPWRRRLVARSDARGRTPWWTLFRTEGAADDRPRVVWGDIARRPRAAVLDAGDPTVPLNSCYVVPCDAHDDALTLAAILNSPLAAAWLAALAEPARGGYVRLLGWTVGRLPLPRRWSDATRLLAPLAREAIAGATLDDHRLLEAVLDAYGLPRSAVLPLLARGPHPG